MHAHSLRDLTQSSIANYAGMLAQIAAFSVDIVSTHQATVTYTAPAGDAARQRDGAEELPESFFVLDLKVVNGMVNYSTPPNQFEHE